MSEQIAGSIPRPESSRIWDIIRDELKPFPGRDRFALRMAVTCTAMVLVSNTFKLPLQDVLPFLILFASKEEKVTTAITCVLAVTAVTVAVGGSLLIFKLTAGRPEFRIPGMAVEIFIGMYLFRILAVGPAGFILAFIVSVSQSIVDLFPTPEEAVHEFLWVWAAVSLAVCFAWIANFLLFAVPPTRLLQREFVSCWRSIAAASAELINGSPAAARRLLGTQAERGPTRLLKLLKLSLIDAQNLEPLQPQLVRLILGADKITKLLFSYVSALLKSSTRSPISSAEKAALGGLKETANHFEQEFATALVPSGLNSFAPANTADLDVPKLVEAERTVIELLAPGVEPGPDKKTSARKKSFFVPDAFSNPTHVEFALKVTLSGMIGYIFYTASDYFGIHTVYYTPLIIALASTGATMYKGLLRMVGCMIGVILGLGCSIWVIPRYETLGMYLFIVFCVHALSAWICLGSDRISYIGLQIALAFDLGVLREYGPPNSIDPLRDRFIGIVLGIVIITVVFSLVWPESAKSIAWDKLAACLRAIARLLRVGLSADSSAQRQQLELGIGTQLAEANAFTEQARFEALLHGFKESKGASLEEATAAVEEVYVASLPWLSEPGASETAESTALIAGEVEEVANAIEGHRAVAAGTDFASQIDGGSESVKELIQAVKEVRAVVPP